MKKIICLLALAFLFNNNLLINKVYADENINNFEELPKNYELFSRSDVSHTNISFENQEMIIAHNNINVKNKQYFGSLLRLDKNKYYQNFTFEMEFKITSAVNEKSWVGLMYHSQQETNYLSGYLNKYQYGGGCNFIAIDDKATFYNDIEKASSKLNNDYHKIKVEINKNSAYQYLDDTLIFEYDLRTKDSVLGYTKTKGEMDLIISNLTINIKNISILGDSEFPSDTNPIVSTYQDENNITNAPTVILDLKKKEQLNFNEKLPSNIILHVDDNLNVIDEKNEIIDSFNNVLINNLNHKIIPIIYLSSSENISKLVSYLNENTELIDLAVMSNNPTLLKQIKEEKSFLRAIYEVNDFNKDDVKIANMNYANVIALNQNSASIENISYIHARFKTAWVKLNSNTKLDIYNTINSGTYGIISDDYLSIYDAYQDYPKNSVIRNSFNVAHRGLSKKYNENSLSGCLQAIKSGATHVEIDGYLTTDNEIVIMHDNNVDRTSSGTGNIEKMTLQEVKQLKLDLVEPYEEIPTLKEIIKGMKDLNTDAVLMFEIKSANINIIKYLKEVIEEYDFYDHIVAISFYLESLKEMKRLLPEIPTAYLGQVTSKKFVEALKIMGEYNTGVDTNKVSDTNFNEQYLKDHGLVGYYWTYGTQQDYEKASLLGLVGLAFDEADTIAKTIKYITANDFITNEEIKINNVININTHLYDKTIIEETGEIFYLEEYDDYYLAICKYSSSTRTFYSNQIKITKEIKQEEHIEENKTNVHLIVIISVSSVSLLGLAIFFIIKFIKK